MSKTMEQSPERVEQFKTEIAEMNLRDPSTARDRQLLWLGIILLIVGIVVAIYAYTLSHGTNDALQQRDAIVVGLAAVCVSIAGGALFVRYSLAQFLRFWIARVTYEQQAQTDRIVDALKQRDQEPAR
jgi:cell division protein FtsW (lipid II flippase)